MAFSAALGLDAPAHADGEDQVQIATPGGATLGFVTEAMARRADPDWIAPFGMRVTVASRCDDVAELDATYARVVAAGHTGLKAPWDAFWGQRYAFLQDPDGNRVDISTPIEAAGAE